MASVPGQLYLCLDCGGSKTAAAISNAKGEIVARGTGGPSNYTDVGMTAFLKSVKAAVTNALSALPNRQGEPPELPHPKGVSYFDAVWVGASGVDRPQDIVDLKPKISELLSIPPGDKLLVANDTHLLASPLLSYPEADTAITVVGGTGSIVVSFRLERGTGKLEELGRVGGWGWILGDEGSGFHVGKETLRWILTENDKRSVDAVQQERVAEGSLQKRIFDHFGISSPPDIFSVVYAADPPPSKDLPKDGPSYLALERKHRITSLTPLVFSAAFDSGDCDALQILRTTSMGLATQIRAILSSKSAKNKITPKETVLCFGGSLVGVDKYRQMVVDHLKEGGGHVFAAVEFVKDAADSGAIGLAKRFGSRV
ncbi:hypothetical protein FRC02_002424 [Tulasnella sp. 418]|nr:hypothetical protein FRC02_002424 [Tulasnella sp. 418]